MRRALVLAAALIACGDDEPPMQRGITPGTYAPPAEGPAPAAEPTAARARSRREPPPPPSLWPTPPPAAAAPASPGGSAATPTTANGAGAGAKDKPKERDLGKDVAALADAGQCLDLDTVAAQPGAKITVTVSAFLMPSGRITSAQVSAPGQASKAIQCMLDRLDAARLGGKLPEQPRRVSGTIPIEVQPKAEKP